jgi:uncharacterized protein (DUF1697 family)
MASRQKYVALLRGVNLGSQRRVNMAALRTLLESHGHEDVRTYLQSGNVILTSSLTGPKLEQALEEQLLAGLGFGVDVLVRSGEELDAVLRRDPLRKIATDPTRYLVTFLRAAPPQELVDRLSALQVSPERVVVDGRELFSWHPDGIGRSKLAKLLLPSALGISASARNRRVVGELAKLAGEG